MNIENLKLTALINGLSLLKIPLLAFCSPRVLAATDRQSIVRIALDWRTKNHVGVMYFGALAMGAELSVALKAITEIQKSGKNIEFIFKDFKCDFLKRADEDVHFICDQADQVADLIHRASETTERLEGTYHGHAIVPKHGPEPVMAYQITLSVKQRVPKNKKA